MSERREGFVTHENLWSNQAYDIQGDKTRIHVREVLPGDDWIASEVSAARITELESQLAELREAAWTLHDYVDLPPSDYGTDDLEQAWDLFRDVQKKTESEASDEAT